MTEADLMRSIILACSHGNTRLFRNNTGALPDVHGRLVRFGLGVGSSDLIGLREGKFIAIETKLPGQKPTAAQVAFIDIVRRLGGRAGVARSVDEAVRICNGEEVN